MAKWEREIYNGETFDQAGSRMINSGMTDDEIRDELQWMFGIPDSSLRSAVYRSHKFSTMPVDASGNVAALATPRQEMYLVSLGVAIETQLTKSRASELIDAAKSNHLGSVSGFYVDGSN